MKDTVKLIIKITKDAKIAFDNAESNDLKGCYYDHGGVIGNAIKNGIPLPKGHGRLIDADVLWDLYHSNDYDFYEALDRAPTIIEADRSEEE